jgi:hypothetical protein
MAPKHHDAVGESSAFLNRAAEIYGKAYPARSTTTRKCMLYNEPVCNLIREAFGTGGA